MQFKFNSNAVYRNIILYMFVCEVIIEWYLDFITCLYFPLVLIRWSSSHCHLMKLFKSKESFKEKVDLNNNWKTAWPRMILEWHLFLRLSLGFVWKMLSFVRRCLFIFCIFYLNEKELNQQVYLIKYAQNETSNSTSHKKERERERSKNISNFKNFNSKTPEKL